MEKVVKRQSPNNLTTKYSFDMIAPNDSKSSPYFKSQKTETKAETDSLRTFYTRALIQYKDIILPV